MPQDHLSSLDTYIASRLKAARSATRIPAARVAEALGVSHQQYSRYERGVNRIGASTLYFIARYFDLPVAWFFMGYEPDVAMGSLADEGKSYVSGTGEDRLQIVAQGWSTLTTTQQQSIVNHLESFTLTDRK